MPYPLTPTMSQPASVSAREIEKFDSLAAQWWDPKGPMRPLHAMNPARSRWILERIGRRFGTPHGVRLLDIGCGAGLLSETLARAGCDVLGIDAAPGPIAAATAHAAGQGLNLTYRADNAETLLAQGQRFAVITALEVVEHVTDPAAFIAMLGGLLEPGGLLFISTLNRTRRSYLVAKLGAEYLLRLLPVGTHDWQAFITPAELAGHCRAAGLHVDDLAGLTPAPLAGGFRASRDLSVNYIALACAPQSAR